MRGVWGYLRQRPRLAVWLALAAGMVVVVLAAARGKGYSAAQLGWMVAGAIALASASARLIEE